MAQVTLAPEVIYHVGNIKITNTILATFLVDVILLTFVLYVKNNLKLTPGTVQTVVEGVVSYFYDTTEQIAGKFTKVIFPWFASFFIFIFTLNIVGLLPGFGSIGFFEHEGSKKIFVP